jgi:hypothetical protein
MTKQKKEARFNLLIDTCVWLDVAKVYQQQAILAALEELIRQGDIALILPRTVVDEIGVNPLDGTTFFGTFRRKTESRFFLNVH